MEQQEFESLISAYTDKIIDEDCQQAKYVINKNIKAEIINRSGEVIDHHVYKAPRKVHSASAPVGRPLLPVVTPKGTFLSVHHAALAHEMTVIAMRSKIRYQSDSKNPLFYFVKSK